MTQRVADPHELLNRWREIADELAAALVATHLHGNRAAPESMVALRRYEEASKS